MSKVVLITGVAGGIGRATSEVFEEAGWHVVGVDRSEVDNLPGVRHFFCADVSDIVASRRIFSEIADEEGHIDAVINNAAIQISRRLVETTPDEWDAVMASNLRSVYLTIHNAYPLMRTHGGAIVNVSSVHAIATSANIAAYTASKGGLLALTRALAIELAGDKIRVNAVLPGAVDTPMLRSRLICDEKETDTDVAIEALRKRTVIGRVGEPAEIAQAILFLADDRRSSFVTGQMLVVDGGATARLSTD